MAKKLFVSNKDESARMFKSDFIEAFSKVHWFVPLLIYIPLISFFLYRSITASVYPSYVTDALPMGWIIALSFVLGIFFWTLLEYMIHRFIFHYEPESQTGKRFHFIAHGVHHDYPNDSKRLVMPPSVSLPLGAFFFFLFTVLFGPGFTNPLFAGLLTGYLYYDITHYALHHFKIKNSFFLELKKHHMKHHFQDPDNGYGISLKLWDSVFGTNYPDERKTGNRSDSPDIGQSA